MIGEYVDDSKEILKEFGGLDEDDDDELEEDVNGTTKENDLHIIDL